MISRRNLLTSSAAFAAGQGLAPAATTKHLEDLESRIARRDFADLYKEDLPTPCMIVDQELFEANLRTMAEHCKTSGIQLRGHVKVHKSPEIAKRQIALGGIGLTCATVAECELMSHAGFTNILLTRQVASTNNIARVMALAQRDATFATVADDPIAVDMLQEAAAAEGIKLKTVVDIYAGLARDGIAGGGPALDLAKKIDLSKNLKLSGMMGYSGGAAHTHGWMDRKKKSREDTAGLLETVAVARSAGLPIEIVTGGSTGTYNIDSEIKGLTELQAGSFVFMDTLYKVVGGKDNPHEFADFGMALAVMTTVISRRHPNRASIDAGNKALLKTTDEVKGRPEVKIENAGAEYGALVWTDTDREFKLGERVEIYPSNLDTSTNVYDRYYIARGERIVDAWPIMGRTGAAHR